MARPRLPSAAQEGAETERVRDGLRNKGNRWYREVSKTLAIIYGIGLSKIIGMLVRGELALISNTQLTEESVLEIARGVRAPENPHTMAAFAEAYIAALTPKPHKIGDNVNSKLTQAQAIEKARELWGDMGWVWYTWSTGDRVRCVGVKGATRHDYTAYGIGPTWEQAFADADRREAEKEGKHG